MTEEHGGRNGRPQFDDHVRMATTVTQRYLAAHGHTGEDLYDTFEYSDALLGLMKACRTYDPNILTEDGKSIEFSTYAWRCIWREIGNGRKSRMRQQKIPVTSIEELSQRQEGVFEIQSPPEREKLPPDMLKRFCFQDVEGEKDSDRRCKKLLYEFKVEELTLKELGERHNISKERASQLTKRGLRIVREQYGDEIELYQHDNL